MDSLSRKLGRIMNSNKKYIVLLVNLLATFFMSHAIGQQHYDTSALDIDKFIQTLRGLDVKMGKSKLDIARMQTLAKVRPEENSWPAILLLWAHEANDSVTLLWWEKDDRQTRILVVALNWCNLNSPPNYNGLWEDGIYPFPDMVKRFNEVEKKLRLEEIQFVKKNFDKIAKELCDTFGKYNTEEMSNTGKLYDKAKKGAR